MYKNSLLVLLLISLVSNSCQKSKNPAPAIHPALLMKTVPQGVGVNIHFYEGNENDWSMIDSSGLGIVRMDVSWNGIEKQAGQYDFSSHDELVRQLERRNSCLLFIIDYGNPLYDEGRAPYTDNGREAYKRFCSALAARYADKQIIWELWNEPNLNHFWTPAANVDDYMAWCHLVVPVIREKDPDACIVAPAISSFDIPFLEDCFDRGLLELVDGVTVHPYRNAWLGPETALDEYEIVKILIEQYRPPHKIIPVISGEWGYSATHTSPEKQGDYLVRQWLSNMIAGIPVSIWYDWHDDGQDPGNAEHNFGTVFWDYQPKPAFEGMRLLISELSGYLPGPRISLSSKDDYLLPFFKEKNVKFACWTTVGPHKIQLPADLKMKKAIAHSGQIQDLSVETSLSISQQPVFIETEGPLPEWLTLLHDAFQADHVQAEKCIRAYSDKNAKDLLAAQILKALDSANEQEKRVAYQSLALLASKSIHSPELALKVYHDVLQNNRELLIQKQILNALSRLAVPASLPYVERKMDDPQLMQEAANFYLSLACKLAKEGKQQEAKDLLVQAARISKHRYAVERVIKVLEKNGEIVNSGAQRELARRAGFINQWWLAGPFPNENDNAEQYSYFPEKEIDFSQKVIFDSLMASWEKVELDGIYAIIPFAKKYGKKQLAAYAFATVELPEKSQGILKIGSNDGVICWVNGEKVHENILARSLVVDEDTCSVSFRKGANRILLKVPNKGADWEACLRVCDAAGMPLDLNQ